MYDIQIMTQDLVEQLTEYAQDAPPPLDRILHRLIYADELYETCEKHIIEELAAMEEERREEAKYEQFDTED